MSQWFALHHMCSRGITINEKTTCEKGQKWKKMKGIEIIIDLQFENSNQHTNTHTAVRMPSRLSNMSFPVPVATFESSEEVKSAPQMMRGRAKPRLPGKQTTIPSEFMEGGSWLLHKDESGKITYTKEW